MNMKQSRYILTALLFLSVVFLGSCKEKPGDEGSLRLTLAPYVGNVPLTLGAEQDAGNGMKYKIEVVRYYVDNVSLVDAANESHKVADVMLVDASSPETQTVEAVLPVGNYTGVKVGVGLDATRNAEDPATFGNEDPQSTFHGMYWTWASKYIFLKFEGWVDTTGTGNQYDHAFLYHCGLDEVYQSVQVSKSIDILSEETLEMELKLDLHKVLFGSDPVDVVSDFITHSTDNLDLATRVVANFANCIE